MSLIGVAVLGITVTVIGLLLKSKNSEMAFILSLAAGIMLLIVIVGLVKDTVGTLKNTVSASGVDTSYLKIAIKSLGICYISDFASDLCRDYGQSSLAAKIDMVGRITIVGLCLPMVSQIIKITSSLIGS